ncbi:hypothetical protein [Streptomyces huiliensis]|uniref:hypothetical protein n=1 Tax=Streptomyces huiliensis TaxID=2876027 RepID=UPI001CC00471|nr:hypothetical protein [Streptomyces huiliensis]MBZ4319952.1 hypothetical protein [Streptomyces huiliensis]
MSEANDTLATLLIFAAFLHILTLLRMILHTPLAADQPDNNQAQQQPLTARPLARTAHGTLHASPICSSGMSTAL